MKIVVSHPQGNPFSYHAARAFAEADWLSTFETGFIPPPSTSLPFRLLPPHMKLRARNRVYDGISRAQQRSHRVLEMFCRAGAAVRRSGLTREVNWYDLLFWGHDLMVANGLSHDIDAVYAYEDGARRTFAMAKKRGAAALYELPLGYFRGVEQELRIAQADRPEVRVTEEPRWKRDRKHSELAGADVVIVPCAWAKSTLKLSPIATSKPIITVPYATPADVISSRATRPTGPFTALFAGQIGLRKGVPYLVEAWRRLNLPDARLWLAGSFGTDNIVIDPGSKRIEHLGALPHSRLLDVMRQVDLFVFPSLAEGFGLVIGEAMACGLPVLTTVNTGGPELITDGREGWCVKARDIDALCERLEWAYHHRDKLEAMGSCARMKAEQWTWTHYRKRLTEEIAIQLR